MEFAFLDESGDCGVGGTKFQITALMCTSDCKEIVRIIRDAKKRLLDCNKSARWLNKKGGEIKWNGFPDDSLLRRILSDLSKLNIHIHFIAFEKGKTKLPNQTKALIIGSLFDRIKGHKKEIGKVIADMDYFEKCKQNDSIFLLEKYEEESEIIKTADSEEKTKKTIKIGFVKSDRETYEKLKSDASKVFIKVEHENSKYSESCKH